jgi:DNA-binding transcriptional ArsR family regulator
LRENNPDSDLKGTTLRVYKLLLREGKALRVTEIQRTLSLSSASVAQYHLDKLLNMGLIQEEQSGFIVVRVVIENVIRIRRRLIPIQAAYVAFFTFTLSSMVVILAMSEPVVVNSLDFIALSVNIVALAVSLIEMRRTLAKTI